MKIQSVQALREFAAACCDGSRPPYKLLISVGTCGLAAGAGAVLKAARDEIAARQLENAVELVEVGCMGLCYAEPVLMITDRAESRRLIYGDVTAQRIPAILSAMLEAVPPEPAHRTQGIIRNANPRAGEQQARIVLRNTGRINPEHIEEYLASGGYAALGKVLTEMSSQEVIDLITASGLRGRGGGGFPTGKKWMFAAQQPAGEKFILCNADEGESRRPVQWIARARSDPHALLEARPSADRHRRHHRQLSSAPNIARRQTLKSPSN